MVRSRRWLLGASLLACLALAAPASATTRTVSTTADSGGGSLRATVAASGNGDKVVVPAGTYTLTSAQIPIAKSIEVEGAGSGSTTIAGNGADRIFDLQNTGAVKISKLALDIRSTAHGGVIYGGGIRTDAASPLTLAGVRISGVANVSGGNNQSGGVLYGAAIYALGNLTLTGTTIDGVRGLSTGGSGTGGGGGVIYGTVYAGKDLSIAGSSIGSGVLDAHATGNTHNGGVIYGLAVYHPGGTSTPITNSGFDGNTGNVNGSAGGGGGGVLYATLYLSSTTLTLSHVSASRNTATSIGGSGGGDGGVTYGLGLYRTSGSIVADHFNASGNSMRVNGTGPGDADGGVAYAGGAYVSASDPETISFDDSAFEGNSIDAHAEGSGSGGVPYGAGFYAYGSGAVALTRAGISANTEDATARGTGNGGVAYAPGLYTSAPATLTNVTIAGNSADAGAGSAATGGVAYGGGLYMTGGGNVLNATVAGNRVLTSAGGTSYAGNVYPGGTIHVKNTIVSGGQATTKPNCNTALTSDGHNIEDKDECGFHAGGDQFNKDPTLGPLANNGGPSLTRRLLPGSLAINSGDNSGCPATDQRGFPRQGTCDKGAYEYQPADLGLTMRAPAKVGIGAQIDYAVTLKNAGPVSAFGTVLRDPLPAGLAPAGASFPTGPCTVAQVTPCPLGTVGAGQSVAGHVLATATTLGTVQNKVGFTTFSDDANPANDTAAATTKVVHVAAGKVKVPKTIKLGSALPVLQKAKKKKKPKPQFIVFNLNGPAKVTLTFQRKRGKKYKSAGKLTVAGHTGKNKVRFAGRLSKKKRLKPGRYRLVLVAIDATKHKSKPVKRQFKLVKAKKK